MVKDFKSQEQEDSTSKTDIMSTYHRIERYGSFSDSMNHESFINNDVKIPTEKKTLSVWVSIKLWGTKKGVPLKCFVN